MSLIDFLQKVNAQYNSLNNLNNTEHQQYQLAEQQALPMINFKKHAKTRAIPFLLAVFIAFCITTFIYVMNEGYPDFDLHLQSIVSEIEKIEY